MFCCIDQILSKVSTKYLYNFNLYFGYCNELFILHMILNLVFDIVIKDCLINFINSINY